MLFKNYADVSIFLISGFILKYKSSDGEWKQLDLDPDRNSLQLKNLKCGTYYFISLQVKNIVGKSEVGSLLKATTKGGGKHTAGTKQFHVPDNSTCPK